MTGNLFQNIIQRSVVMLSLYVADMPMSDIPTMANEARKIANRLTKGERDAIILLEPHLLHPYGIIHGRPRASLFRKGIFKCGSICQPNFYFTDLGQQVRAILKTKMKPLHIGDHEATKGQGFSLKQLKLMRKGNIEMTKNDWKPISEYNSEVHGDIVLVCGGSAYIGDTREAIGLTSPVLALQLGNDEEGSEWVEATLYSEFYAELSPTHFMMVPEPV